MFLICFIFSLSILLAFVIWWLIQRKRYDRIRIFTPRIIIIMGVALATLVWYLPINFSGGYAGPTHPLVYSILNAIKIFTANGIENHVKGAALPAYYLWLGNILSIWAPVLTLTVIFSLFNSFWSYGRYLVGFKKETHVFSELNERSLAIAKTLQKNGKCVIAFANISEENKGARLELLNGARKINAIFLKNDLEAIWWGREKSTKRKLNFYLISGDKGAKVRHSQNIVERYNTENCSLFIFDNSEETKLLLRDYRGRKDEKLVRIKIVRIDETRLLTYAYLSTKGPMLFKKATKVGDIENINVAIVGFGDYGAEMFKALFWYCQMPRYKVNFTIFDKDPSARSRFEAKFPGITLGKDFDGSDDARYRIDIKNCTFGEKQFIDEVKLLPADCLFFLFMGDDDTNLLAIDAIKCARAQAGVPDVKSDDAVGNRFATVVYNHEIKSLVSKSRIDIINEKDEFFLLEKFEESNFIEDGFEEHKLGCGGDSDVILFGFGTREQEALKAVSEYYLGRDLIATVHTNGERVDNYSSPSNVKIRFDSVIDFGSISYNKPIVICFDGNGVKNPDELRSNEIDFDFVPCENDPPVINAFLKAREEELEQDYTKGYYLDDYCFYSSLSRALHRKLHEIMSDHYSDEVYVKVLCSTKSCAEAKDYKHDLKIRRDDPSTKDAAEHELYVAAKIEHTRWNAYMLSEGNVYNAKRDKDRKMHHLILPLDVLPAEEYIKDI